MTIAAVVFCAISSGDTGGAPAAAGRLGLGVAASAMANAAPAATRIRHACASAGSRQHHRRRRVVSVKSHGPDLKIGSFDCNPGPRQVSRVGLCSSETETSVTNCVMRDRHLVRPCLVGVRSQALAGIVTTPGLFKRLEDGVSVVWHTCKSGQQKWLLHDVQRCLKNGRPAYLATCNEFTGPF